MEESDLVAKTAQKARVAESTAANVLEAAGIIESEESRGGQRSVATSVKGQGTTQSKGTEESPVTDEPTVSSEASERIARKQALEKAEAAFGGPEEPDYSERSGLLA